MTKTPTLVANRLYFGLEALRLRDSTDRVLARVVGIPPDRATVGWRRSRKTFAWALPRVVRSSRIW